MGCRRGGQPVGVEPEAEEPPPIFLVGPVLIFVACMEDSVIVEDQHLAGLQQLGDPQFVVIRESVEETECRDRVRRKRCPLNFRRAFDERAVVKAAQTTGPVDQDRDRATAPSCARGRFVRHEEGKARFEHRQQLGVIVPDRILDGCGAAQPIIAAAPGRRRGARSAAAGQYGG